MVKRLHSLLCVLLLIPLTMFGEGSKQLTPNQSTAALTNAANDKAGYLSHDGNFPSGTGVQVSSLSFLKPFGFSRNGATFSQDHRLYVRVKNGETLHYGVRRALHDQTALNQGDLTITIRRITATSGLAGEIVQSTTLTRNTASTRQMLLNTNQPGVIATPDQALIGPNRTGVTTGYNSLNFVNTTGADQDYFVEFTQVGESTMDDGQRFSVYDLWDFTVINQQNVEKQGRLHSKLWSFSAGGATNVFSKDFNMYPLVPSEENTSTFYVKKLELAGIAPQNFFRFVTNRFGSTTTVGTSVEARRRSQNSQTDYPEFFNFVNNPDPEFWPSADAPAFSVAITSGCNPNGGGKSTFYINSSVRSTFMVLIDLNGIAGYQIGTTDVLLESTGDKGPRTLEWNGRDGQGGTVASGRTLTYQFKNGSAPVHFPMWDAEWNDGFRVEDVRPLVGSNYNGLLYWDDINITSSTSSTDFPVQRELFGAVSTPGVHRWGSSSSTAGDLKTINTWTYGYTNTSSQTALYTYTNCSNLVDVAVTKTAVFGTYALGVNMSFTVTATNNSTTLAATGVKVIDQINTEQFEFVSATPSVGTFSNTTGTWDIGTLAASTARTLTITVKPRVLGSVANTANQTHSEPEPNTTTANSNNSATATVTVQAAADIRITNTVSQTTVNNGDLVTYTITATNNGPSPATGVSVTDKLPAGLTLEGAVPAGYDPVSGLWSVGALAIGETKTITLTARVSQLGNITTTATLGSRAAFQFDPESANNSESNTITVNASADVAITNSVSTASTNQGEVVTFTIVAGNNGPNNATNVVVNSPIPAGLNITGSSASLGTYSGGIWTVGTILPGTTQTLTLTARPTGTGEYVLIASQTHTEFDRVATNNSAQASVAVAATADVAITNSVTAPAGATYANNEVITYTVVVTNNGPSQATNVLVTDQLPASLTYVSSTNSAGTELYVPATGRWSVGTLANGASATLTITARVNESAVITTTATQTHTEFDNVNGNNSASISITSGTGVITADIAVTVTKSDGPYYTNQPITFTVRAANLGPDAATNLNLQSLIPAGFTLVSATPKVGSYDAVAGTWNIGNLASGGFTELILVASPNVNNAEPGDINYTFTATKASATQADGNAGNNSASLAFTVQKAVDPAVTISVTGDQSGVYYRGLTEATFLLTVTNNGPDRVTNLVGADTRTGTITFTSVEAGKGYNPATGIWTIDELAAGESITLEVKGIPNTTGRLFLGGEITGQTQTDINLGNNKAVALLTVLPQADLSISNTVAAGPYYNGITTTFTVAVSNNSLVDAASGVVIRDLLPAGFEFVGVTTTDGTYDPTTGLWTLDSELLPGATQRMVLTVKPVTTGNLTTAASIFASDQFDNVVANNTAVRTITVAASADIAVSNSISDGPFTRNTSPVFTVVVTNLGPNVANNVIVMNTLPDGYNLGGGPNPAVVTGGTYTNNSNTWNIGTLQPNSSVTLTLTLNPQGSNADGVKNFFSYKSNSTEYDPNGLNTQSGNNSSVLSFTVGDQEATYALAINNQHFYQYKTGDVIAVATDLDGTIVSATLASGSLLPAGITLASNGNVVVEDRFKVRPGTYSLTIITTDNGAGTTTSTVTFTITADWDGDGVSDFADLDDNNDGILDVVAGVGVDPFGITGNSLNYNYSNPAFVHPVYGAFRDLNADGINDWFDRDLDGIINSLDVDMDGDGITNITEAFGGKNPSSDLYSHSTGTMVGAVNANGIPLSSLQNGVSIFAATGTNGTSYAHYLDTDKDGFADFLDVDSDNDGIIDFIEAQQFSVGKTGFRFKSLTDANQDGLNDAFDVNNGGELPFTPFDFDASLMDPDGIPDYLDLDSDNDTMADFYEAHDSNLNGIALDDLLRLAEAHRTQSGLTSYSTTDNNGNGVPNWLEKNAQGIPLFLVPGSDFYFDTDRDGLVDLFDANSFGSEAVPAQKAAASQPDFRNSAVATPLPVTLTSFTGKWQKAGVQLDWTTAAEKDNDYFQVERSKDGKTFLAIGQVKGNGTSQLKLDYNFLDAQPLEGTVYYRLKQVDFDGKFEYSKTIAVSSKALSTQVTVTAYPNPTTGAIQLTFEGAAKGQATIRAYALDGRLVGTYELSIGSSQTIDLQKLAVGTYILKISGPDFEAVQRVVKQ